MITESSSSMLPPEGTLPRLGSAKRHSLSGWLLLAGDILAFFFAFLLTCWMLSPQDVGLIDNRSDMIVLPEGVEIRLVRELAIFMILAPILLFLVYNKGHYRHRVPWWGQLQYVALCCVFGLFADGFIHYMLNISFPVTFLFGQWIATFCLIMLFRQMMRLVAISIKKWHIPAIMLADGNNALFTLFAMSSDKFPGYRVDKILLRHDALSDFQRDELPVDMRNVTLADGSDSFIAAFIRTNPHYFYIIALDTFQGTERETLLELLEKENAEYAIVPPIKRVSLYGMEPHIYFGHDTMFLRPKDTIHSPLALALKRLMDISGALVGLLLSSPLFLIVWIMKRIDRTKMYYGHTRIGKNGKPFNCWKFQSMVANSQEVLDQLLATNEEARKEWEKDFKLKNDPRVTKIGNILRKTSLDELPQLWNVLKGEMSLVGPRPITVSEEANYGKYIEDYKSVKPGVTGLWQVNGRNDTTYDQRVYLDSWYVRNWSVWHDIVILFKTVRILLFRSGAY